MCTLHNMLLNSECIGVDKQPLCLVFYFNFSLNFISFFGGEICTHQAELGGKYWDRAYCLDRILKIVPMILIIAKAPANSQNYHSVVWKTSDAMSKPVVRKEQRCLWSKSCHARARLWTAPVWIWKSREVTKLFLSFLKSVRWESHRFLYQAKGKT